MEEGITLEPVGKSRVRCGKNEQSSGALILLKLWCFLGGYTKQGCSQSLYTAIHRRLIVHRTLINNELLFKIRWKEKKFPQSLWINWGLRPRASLAAQSLDGGESPRKCVGEAPCGTKGAGIGLKLALRELRLWLEDGHSKTWTPGFRWQLRRRKFSAVPLMRWKHR